MPRVLIVCAHRPKRSPSQRYRFEQYLPFLQEQGFVFTFSWLLNEKDDRLFYSKGNLGAKFFILLKSFFIRAKDCFRFKKFDTVFIQREALFTGTSFIERIASKSGAYVIFDFDDSIWLADTSPGNRKWEFLKRPAKFFETISSVNCVIAGNTYLAEKVMSLNKNTLVIPTTIDTNLHTPKPELRNTDVLTIGWSGSISTVKHFATLIPVLLKIKARYAGRIKFKVLGDRNFSHPDLNAEALAWSEEDEVKQLNTFDIGIMPLPDNEWANGKCGLKGLSYMACEVPVILSAVGVNNEIITHGENGFLAYSEQDWYNLLCTLIEDEPLRQKLGREGRKTVVAKYSVAANKNKYLTVFRQQITLD